MGSFFVHRPVFAMVISIVIVICGFVSMGKLPVSQYPSITPPEVQVNAVYTGASALDIEQSVATPLEQKINGVEDSIYMRSINASDGTLSLRVTFEVGTDLDMANVLVQNRVSEAQASLPEEVKRLGVTVKKSLSFPLMLITLRSPNGSYDSDFLTNYMNINIIDAIARIKGVGQTTPFGGSDYAMRIWVRPDRLTQLGLTIPDITKAIRDQNVITPAGKIGADFSDKGSNQPENTYTVRTRGRLKQVEEFENVVVRSNPDGSQVLVKDVARVELGAEKYTSKGRINGSDAAVLAVYQSPGSNGLEISANVREAMDELSQRFPEDIEHTISLDTTLAIDAGIQEILTTLWQAILLVILVVFIFLQSWRATIIPLVAIPVSLIGTFSVFPLLGFSINTISLLGLVLAIGTVVDDAIVVVESVTAHIEKGLSPKEATIKTMEEVGGAIIATSLALIAVFVPVGFMEGITGRLYQQFAITIAVSVAFSSINALTLSPALASILLKPKGDSSGRLERLFQRFNAWLDKTTGGYLRIADGLVKGIRKSVGSMAAIVAAVVILGKVVPGGFMPEEDQGYLLVNVQLPDAVSLKLTDNAMNQVGEILGETDAIESYTAITGFSLLSSAYTTNNGFVFVSLKPWAEREETAKEIALKINKRFAMEIQSAVAMAFGPPAIPGLGSGSGFSLMLQDRVGQTPEYLAEQAATFIQAARARPEIASAFTMFRPSSPQRLLDIDRSQVLKKGVQLSDVNTALGAFLGGAYINDFNRFGRLYKVYVQAEPAYRREDKSLELFSVRGTDNSMVPLSTLLNIPGTLAADTRLSSTRYAAQISGPEFTNRFDLFRSAEIQGVPAPGYSSAQAMAALEEVAASVLPSDMSYAWNAMSYQEAAAAGSAGVTLLMAMVFVYLILAAQYESWTTPLSVLLGTPFAVLGAFGGLWLARFLSDGYVVNVFAQIGLVLLVGLAAKNAILIVEFAKQKREEGLGPVEAALESAKLRFRPILMTAFSFILGVLPLLVATGAGAEARKVIGVTVFSGMLAATILGVCFVPVLFVIVEKLFPSNHEA